MFFAKAGFRSSEFVSKRSRAAVDPAKRQWHVSEPAALAADGEEQDSSLA